MNAKLSGAGWLTGLTVGAVSCLVGLRAEAVDIPCALFPSNSIWNTRIDVLPVDASSSAYIASIGADTGLHADFGAGLWNGAPIGIPFVLVPGDQPRLPVTFDYSDESDPGPYPIPDNPPIEGGPASTGDRHVLIVDVAGRTLYELYSVYRVGGQWQAGSGAIYDLTSHVLRPDGWTSADAAGLPILPGLVRYEEVASGTIRHAIRFTVPRTRRAKVWPARHVASSLTSAGLPPMGQRFRLRRDFAISTFSPDVQVILRAMQLYGIILADNGAAWFVSGVPDDRWNNDHLAELRNVHGHDFEAVDCRPLMIHPDSAQSRSPAPLIRDVRVSTPRVRLTLDNVLSNVTYRVQSCGLLSEGDWKDVDVFVGDVTPREWSVSGEGSGAAYRLVAGAPAGP